jgi:hypothetical protein
MRLPAALLAAVRENLGDSDLAFNLERSGLNIAVLMPGSEVSQARTKAQELRTAIARKLGGATGPVTVQAQVEELAGAAGTPILRPPGGKPAAGHADPEMGAQPAPGSGRR